MQPRHQLRVQPWHQLRVQPWHQAQVGWRSAADLSASEVRWATEWENLNGYFVHGGLGNPLLSANNMLVLAARATDQGVWVKQQKPASNPEKAVKWGAWKPLGGETKGAPVLTQDADGLLGVVAVGPGSSLFYKEQTKDLYEGSHSKWSPWAYLAKSHGPDGMASVARRTDGSQVIFMGSEI